MGFLQRICLSAAQVRFVLLQRCPHCFRQRRRRFLPRCFRQRRQPKHATSGNSSTRRNLCAKIARPVCMAKKKISMDVWCTFVSFAVLGDTRRQRAPRIARYVHRERITIRSVRRTAYLVPMVNLQTRRGRNVHPVLRASTPITAPNAKTAQAGLTRPKH